MATGSSPQQSGQISVDWHAKSADEVLSRLRSKSEGLRQSETDARRRMHGPNRFSYTHEKGTFSRLFVQLKSPLALVLVGAFGLTLALGEYTDAAVICFALSIALVVGVLQEGRASRAFKTLAESQAHTATVLRGGERHEINAEDLVVGDIVEVHGGMQVPADIRLIEADGFMTNESPLTGEWLPVRKNPETLSVGTPLREQANIAFMGTLAIEGYCRGIVIAIGNRTAVGAIAGDLAGIADVETPLQAEMRRMSGQMLFIIGGLVLAIFVVGVFRGQPLEDMLLVAVAIAVASIPEGLPAAVTIILAAGMEALLRRGGLVRNLLAAETLGSTTYVLTDKTGTLTLANMALTGVIHNDAANLAPATWGKDLAARRILEIALCASDAYVEETEKGTTYRGDPVERAILAASLEVDIDPSRAPLRSARTRFFEFTSENRFAAGASPLPSSEYRLCVNGAPEYLLSLASFVEEDGREHKITDDDRRAYEAAIAAQTKEGKRLIAVAHARVPAEDIDSARSPSSSLIETGLVFMGILVFTDPVRKRVALSIRGVQNAGATVLLVTGDNPATALSVARTVGIAGPSETALTGEDLANLTDEQLLDALHHVHVFARVLPAQKMRIVEALQGRGEVVAMTGDGTNDAPALRRANIGIAVGSGTEVAKEASDLVLIDDSFDVIYAAIEEGRRIVANLRKVVGYLLSTSFSEVVLIGVALILHAPLPLLPAQILWANVIEEGLMSFAFAFEKGEKRAMKEKPEDIYEEGILSARMLWFVLFVVTITSIIIVALYTFVRASGASIEIVRSAMFLMVAIDSLFMAFAFRSLSTPIWKTPLVSNLFFVLAVLLNLALLALVLAIPMLREILSYQPLPASLIGTILLCGIGTLVTIEVGKWLFLSQKPVNAA